MLLLDNQYISAPYSRHLIKFQVTFLENYSDYKFTTVVTSITVKIEGNLGVLVEIVSSQQSFSGYVLVAVVVDYVTVALLCPSPMKGEVSAEPSRWIQCLVLS